MRSHRLFRALPLLALAAPAAAQFPCGSWTEVPVPADPEWNRALFEDVSVLPSGEAWAVGFARVPVPGGSETLTMAMRWDGSQWTNTETPYVAPFPGGANDALNAVAAISSNEVWAAGERYGDAGGLSVGAWIHVIRWDGSSWSEMPVPAPPGGSGVNFSGTRIHDIAAFGSDDIWFSGLWGEINSVFAVTWRPLAMHWDGSNFTVHDTPPLPAVGGFVGMPQMAAVASDDIWGIAVPTTGPDTNFPTALHWDGSTWSDVALPSMGTEVVLKDIVATASDDVWIFAYEYFSGTPFAYHWDGSSFSVVSSVPRVQTAMSPGPGEIYLGYDDIEFFDGTSTISSGSFPNVNGPFVLDMDSASSCLNWAVGRRLEGSELMPFAAVMNGTPPATMLCDGDGTAGVSCPCGNDSTDASRGCQHSLGEGARISLSGGASVAQDQAVFGIADAVPNQSSLLVQGRSQIAAPFKDGILCAGSPTERVEVVLLGASGAGSTSGSIATAGNVAPGDTAYYQFWYRDPGGASPCGTGSNFTPAIELHWQ